MTHTPEPWLARQHGIAVPGQPFEMEPCRGIYKGGWGSFGPCAETFCQQADECSEYRFWQGQMVAESMAAADAQRAVLCVNACKGIPNEALAEGVIDHTMRALRDTYLYLCDQPDPQAGVLVVQLAALMNAHGLNAFLGPLNAYQEIALAGAS